MKKIIVTIALVLFGQNVLAEKISNDQLDVYKTAVSDSVRAQRWDCIVLFDNYNRRMSSDSIEFRTKSVISDASSAEISSNGSQPLLIFYRGGQTVTVTTSANYKSVISMRSTESHAQNVNTGDLRKPKYEVIVNTVQVTDCEAK